MKAVGYVRVSTLKQCDSYEVQLERIESYCRFHNLQLDRVFYDNGVSGAIPINERPDGLNMMVYIRENHILNMVGMKLDRFFRDTIDALNTVALLDKKGISLHVVDMAGVSINTTSATGKLMLTMISAVAEMERNLIAERTSAALQYKKSNGIAYTREVYGFKKVGGVMKGGKMSGGRFEVDPEQMVEIKEIYQTRSLGMGFERIADLLTKKGKKTWHKSTVRAILRNDIYKQYISI